MDANMHRNLGFPLVRTKLGVKMLRNSFVRQTFEKHLKTNETALLSGMNRQKNSL
jgi:hypothetical protein